MAHPQNSPRGLFAKKQINLGAQTLSGNSTCFLLSTISALPATRQPGGIVFVSNSTGKRPAFWNTGTTWKYMSGTSVNS